MLIASVKFIIFLFCSVTVNAQAPIIADLLCTISKIACGTLKMFKLYNKYNNV